jgi:hypothetical protein
MSQYIMKSYGPGSIGALIPGAALSHPPTIGSNDPIRDIGSAVHGASRIPAAPTGRVPSMGGCGCGMGVDNGVFSNGDGVFSGMGTANGNGSMMPFLGLILAPVAAVGIVWGLSKL